MRPERYRRRGESVRSQLEHRGLDGLLVTHLPNVRYLTGFSGTAGVVLFTMHDARLFTDFRYREQAEREVADNVRVEIVERDVWERVERVLSGAQGLSVVGFESHVVTVQRAERLQNANGTPGYRPVADLVEAMRARKAPEEVSAIREAAELAGSAFEATLPEIGAGRREIDVAVRLEAELRRRGSEWHPFQTIVASGPRTALPHARTSDRAIRSGDWVLLDFGAQVDGYCADITRTVVVGRPADERQRMIYELVRTAQARAIGGIRAGMSGREADALARSVIESRGFGDAFGHSLGHGLGLEVHEGPRLSQGAEDPVPEGAVVTVEPGVYFPGWGGVRIEDDVHVTAEGCELLTNGRAELHELP